jgi:hypothetical protein
MRSLKSTQLVLLLIAATMAAPTIANAATANENDRVLQSLNIASVSYDTDRNAIYLNYLVKGIQMVVFLMLIVDCIHRYFGTPLNLMSTYRFAMFCFGASCPWYVGSQYGNSYRGFNENFLLRYFDAMYHSYFGIGYFSVFPDLKSESGEVYKNYFNYINVILIELILFWVLWLSAKGVSKGIENGEKIPNLIGSLEWVNAFFFGFPYVGWSIFWFQQHYSIGLSNDRDNGLKFKRWKFHYILAWIVAVATVFLIFVDGFIGSVTGVLAYRDKIMKRDQVYEETARGTVGTNTERASIQNRPPVTPMKKGNGCTLDELAIEFLFMHQDPDVAAKHPIGIFYFSYFLNRWAWFAVIGIIAWEYPRTMYTGYVIVDVIMIFLTYASLPTFRSGAGTLIFLEEVLILIWHASQMILFYDQGRVVDKNKSGMSENWVWFYVILIFGSYLLTLLIEFILIFVCIFGNAIRRNEKKNSNSEDFRFDAESENNLERKVTQFNNMKSNVGQNSGLP